MTRYIPNRQRGFTLVEVLVASVILFLVIALASDVFRGAMLASEKAQRTVEVSTSLPFIISTIKEQLQIAEDTDRERGSGVVNQVKYEWTARRSHFEAPPERLDPDTLERKTYKEKFALWTVNITIGKGNSSQTYTYQEFTWKEHYEA